MSHSDPARRVNGADTLNNAITIMAYATGLRLLAAVCFLTVIGAPLGVWFLIMARRKEAEREQELEALRNVD